MVLLILILVSVHLSPTQSRTFNYKDDVTVPGDIMLGGLFSLESNSGNACSGRVHTGSIQHYEAVRWFLNKLNARNYIPGVTLGFHAYKTCGDPSLASRAVLKMKINSNNTQLYGFVGPSRSSEAQEVSRLLSSLPEDDRLLQLSYSATASSLANRDIYKNIFRVITPDDVQVEVILQLVTFLKWNYVAVVYDSDAYGTESAEDFRQRATKLNICIPLFSAVQVDADLGNKKISILSFKKEIENLSVNGLIFFGLTKTAITLFKFLDVGFENFQIIVSDPVIRNEDDIDSSSRVRGALVPSPLDMDINEFKRFWKDLHTDPSTMHENIQQSEWLHEYLKEITDCDEPLTCMAKAGQVLGNGELSLFVGYALRAAAVYAQSLKDLHQNVCQGVTGVCPALNFTSVFATASSTEFNFENEFPDELGTSSPKFTFDKGEIHLGNSNNHSVYELYNYQKCEDGFCFKKVGDFVQNRLSVMNDKIKSFNVKGEERVGGIEAQCNLRYECTQCTSDAASEGVYVIPGDYYVVGFVPIHNKNSTSILSCGNLRPSLSVDTAEAMAYAIKRANTKKGRFASFLGTQKVGLIILDTCDTPFIAREKLMKLNTAELKLNLSINSDQVIGYIGPFGSSVSVAVSGLMTDVQKPYISYSSTSTRLSDKTHFPMFLRSCAPDNNQARAMMTLVKLLNSTYVQILYTKEEYGIAGKDALLAAAVEHKVCVAQSIGIEEDTDLAVHRGYGSELRKFRHARTVIVFTRGHTAVTLVQVLNEEILSGEFFFIGAESWGRRTEVIKGRDKLRGSFTLALELPRNNMYEDYFSELNIQSSDNPWLQRYVETRAQCHYPMSFNKLYPETCIRQKVTSSRETNQWVPFVITSVEALLLGFKSTLEEKCGGSATACKDYTATDLIENIKRVELDLYNDGQDIKVFDSNGDGVLGYTISQIIRDDKGIVYKKVGTSGDHLKLLLGNLEPEGSTTSHCQNAQECQLCEEQHKTSSSVGDKSSSQQSVGLVAGVSILAFAVVLETVLVVIHCFRKHRKTVEDPYLTAVPDMEVRYNSTSK